MNDGPTMLTYVDERFKHLEQLFTLGQENAKRAVDKAETAQAAHNIAQNEWRATLTDFRQNMITRPEFERLSADVAAYKLEVSKILASIAGERVSGRESKEDAGRWVGYAIGFAGVLIAVIALIFKH